MEQFQGRDILNFIKELPNDDACRAYLAKIKPIANFGILYYAVYNFDGIMIMFKVWRWLFHIILKKT